VAILVTDPVCGMQVESDRYEIELLQIHYAFCSKQCQERFLANPHLYIGLPEQSAPKQEGKEIVKRRRLRLVQPLSPKEADRLFGELQAMMGIKAVVMDGTRIEITYDLLQATSEQIEAKMAEIGVQLGENWAERLRRAFVHYEEECEVGNLEVHENKYIHRHLE